MITNNLRRKINNFFSYTFLILVSFLSLFPFLWIIIGATNKAIDITSGKLLPGGEFLKNFDKLITTTNIILAFGNTIKITIVATLLTLLITSLAAYGFEKYRTVKRDFIYNIFLLSMMVPFAALMIPLFRLIVKIGLIDNFWGVVLPGIASSFLIFFFRQNFKSIPSEMIEAARIDGASELVIFFKIVLPPMKSTFAAAGIIVFMSHWNNYLWPLIVLQSESSKTLTLVISSLSSAYFVDYGVLMLGIAIATLPTILIFFTMQRHFVEGMVGSSK